MTDRIYSTDAYAKEMTAVVVATDSDDANYVGADPAVSIEKATQTIDADAPADAPLVAAGDVVQWTYTVTNTGNVALTDLVVADGQLPAGSSIDCGAGDATIAVLAVGDSVVCSATGVAEPILYSNLGTVEATGPVTVDTANEPVAGLVVTDDDPSHYDGVAPAIVVETTVQGVYDADTPADAPLVTEGDDVLVTYVVTNPGTHALSGVVVVDDTLGTPVYVSGDTDGDGDIDDSDLGTSFANYTGPVGAAGGKTANDGDTDNDGDVDDSDLGTLFASYTGPVGNVGMTAADGDTDGDGDIDDADLGTMFSNFTGPVGAAGGKTFADGDTDGDGDVDDADLANAFSGFTGPLGPANVPEPGAVVGLVGVGCLLARRRGR